MVCRRSLTREFSTHSRSFHFISFLSPERDGEKASAARSKLPRDYKICQVSVQIKRCLLQLFEEAPNGLADLAPRKPRPRFESAPRSMFRFLLHSEWGPINAALVMRQGQSFDVELTVDRATVCDTMPPTAGRAAAGIADRLVVTDESAPISLQITRPASDTSTHLLAITLNHMPLDEKADICIAIQLMPLEMVFRPSILWRFIAFFKPPKLLDVSTLQSAALSELSGYAQRQAAAYAVVASRKSVWVDMDICAPDIRIPFDQHEPISVSGMAGEARAGRMRGIGTAELQINLGRIEVHTQLHGLDEEHVVTGRGGKKRHGSLLDSDTAWPNFFTEAEEAAAVSPPLVSSGRASLAARLPIHDEAAAASLPVPGVGEKGYVDGGGEPVRSWDDLSDCYTGQVSDVGIIIVDSKKRQTTLLKPASLVLRIAVSAVPTGNASSTVPKFRVAATLPDMHLKVSTSAYDAVMALVLEVIPDAMRTFATPIEAVDDGNAAALATPRVASLELLEGGSSGEASTAGAIGSGVAAGASVAKDPRHARSPSRGLRRSSSAIEGVMLDQLKMEARRGSVQDISDARTMERFAALMEARGQDGTHRGAEGNDTQMSAARVKTLSERGALVLARRLKLLVHFEAPLVDIEVVDDTSSDTVVRPLLRAALLRTMLELTQRTYDMNVNARTSGLTVANLMVADDSPMRNILYAGESTEGGGEGGDDGASASAATHDSITQEFIVLSTNITQRHSPIWLETASEDRYGVTVDLSVGRLNLNADSNTAIDILLIAGRRKMPQFQDVQNVKDAESSAKRNRAASTAESVAAPPMMDISNPEYRKEARALVARTAAATPNSRMKFAIAAGGVDVNLSYEGEPLVSASLLGVSANSRHQLGMIEASATVRHLHVRGGQDLARSKVLGPLVDDDRFMSMGEEAQNECLFSAEVVFLQSWHPKFLAQSKSERAQLSMDVTIGALGLYVSPSFLVHTSATLFKFGRQAAKALLKGQLASLIATTEDHEKSGKGTRKGSTASSSVSLDADADAAAVKSDVALIAASDLQPAFLWKLRVNAADVAVVAVLSSDFYPEQAFSVKGSDGVDTLLEARLRRVAVEITNRRVKGVDTKSKIPAVSCSIALIEGEARGIDPLGGPTVPQHVMNIPNFELQLGPPPAGSPRPLAIVISAPDEVTLGISPAIITFVIAIVAEFTWAVNRLKYLALREGADIKHAALGGDEGAGVGSTALDADKAGGSSAGEDGAAEKVAEPSRGVYNSAAAIAHSVGTVVISFPLVIVNFTPVRLGEDDQINVGDRLLKPIMRMRCERSEMQVLPVEGVVFAMHMGRVDFVDGDLDEGHPAKTLLTTGPPASNGSAARGAEDAIVLEVITGGGQVRVGVSISNSPQLSILHGCNFFRFQEQCAVIRSPNPVPVGDDGELSMAPELNLPGGLPPVSVLVDVECRNPRFWIAPGGVDDLPTGGLSNAPWLLVRFDDVRSVTYVKREGGVLVENTCGGVLWTTIDAPRRVEGRIDGRLLHSAAVREFGYESGIDGLTAKRVTVDVDVKRYPTEEERAAGMKGGVTVTVLSTPLLGRFPPELYLCVSPMNDVNYVINAFVPPEKCFQIRPPQPVIEGEEEAAPHDGEEEEEEESNPVEVLVQVDGMVAQMCGSTHLREKSWRGGYVVLKSGRINVLYASRPDEVPLVRVTADHMVAFEATPTSPIEEKQLVVGRTVLALPNPDDMDESSSAVTVTVTMHPFDEATSTPHHNEVKVTLASHFVARASPQMVGCMYNWWVSEPARLETEGRKMPDMWSPTLPHRFSEQSFVTMRSESLTLDDDEESDSDGAAPPVPSRAVASSIASTDEDEGPPPQRPPRFSGPAGAASLEEGEEPSRWSVAVTLVDGFDLDVPLFESDDVSAQSAAQLHGSIDGGGVFDVETCLTAVKATSSMERDRSAADTFITVPEIAVHLMPSLTLHVDGPFIVGAGGGADPSPVAVRPRADSMKAPDEVSFIKVEEIIGFELCLTRRAPGMRGRTLAELRGNLEGAMMTTTLLTLSAAEYTSTTKTYILSEMSSIAKTEGKVTLGRIDGVLTLDEIAVVAEGMKLIGAIWPRMLADPEPGAGAERDDVVTKEAVTTNEVDTQMSTDVHWQGLRIGIFDAAGIGRMPIVRLGISSEDCKSKKKLPVVCMREKTMTVEALIFAMQYYDQNTLCWEPVIEHVRFYLRCDLPGVEPGVKLTGVTINSMDPLRLNLRYALLLTAKRAMTSWGHASEDAAKIPSSEIGTLLKELEIAAKIAAQGDSVPLRRPSTYKIDDDAAGRALGFTSFRIINNTGAAVRLQSSKARRAGHEMGGGIVSSAGSTTGFELTQLLDEGGSVDTLKQSGSGGHQQGDDSEVVRGKVLPSTTPTVVDAKVDIAIGEYAVLKNVPLQAAPRPQIHLLRDTRSASSGGVKSARRWTVSTSHGRRALECERCMLCSITNVDGATQLSVSSPHAVVNHTLSPLALRFGSDQSLYCSFEASSEDMEKPSDAIFIKPGETYHIPVSIATTDRLQFGLHQEGDAFAVWCRESISMSEIRGRLVNLKESAVEDALVSFANYDEGAADHQSSLCAVAQIISSKDSRVGIIEGQLLITILPIATLCNLLPQTIAFEIRRESPDVEEGWTTVSTGVLRTGETVQVMRPQLGPDSNAHVRCKYVGAGWNKWSTFVPLRSRASSTVEHSFADDDGTVSSVMMARELGCSSNTAVSVRFYCEVWMVNNTNLPLVFGQAGGTKTKPKLSSSTAIAGQQHAVDEFVYENQAWSVAFPRAWVPAKAFVKPWSGHLGQRELTKAKVDNKLRPSSFLGSRWEWAGDWSVDKQSFSCDDDGWQYASTWAYYDKHGTGATGTRKAFGREWKAEKATNSVCRRRRWRRRRQIQMSYDAKSGHDVVTFTRALASRESGAKHIVVRVGTSPWAKGVSLARALGRQQSGQTLNATAMALLDPEAVNVRNGEEFFDLMMTNINSGSAAAALLSGSIDPTSVRPERETIIGVGPDHATASDGPVIDNAGLSSLTREERKHMVVDAARSVLPMTRVLVFSPRLLVRNRSGMAIHVRQAGLPAGRTRRSSMGFAKNEDDLIPGEVDLAHGDTQPFHWRQGDLPLGLLEVRAGRQWGSSGAFSVRNNVGQDLSLLLLRTVRARRGSESPEPSGPWASASGDTDDVCNEEGADIAGDAPFLILRVTVRLSDLGQTIVTIRSLDETSRPQYRFDNQTHFPVQFAQVGADQQRWPPFSAAKMQSLNFALPESMLSNYVEVRVGSMPMQKINLKDLKAKEIVLKPNNGRTSMAGRHSITPSMRFDKSPLQRAGMAPPSLRHMDSAPTISKWLKYNQYMHVSLSTVDGFAVRLAEAQLRESTGEDTFQTAEDVAASAADKTRRHGRSWRTRRKQGILSSAQYSASLSTGLDSDPVKMELVHGANGTKDGRATNSRLRFGDVVKLHCEPLYKNKGATQRKTLRTLTCVINKGGSYELEWTLARTRTSLAKRGKLRRPSKAKIKLSSDKTLFVIKGAAVADEYVHASTPFYLEPVGIDHCVVGHRHDLANDATLRLVKVDTDIVKGVASQRSSAMASSLGLASRSRIDSTGRRGRREGADIRAVRALLEGSWMVARPLYTLDVADNGLNGADSPAQAKAIQLALQEGGQFALPMPPPPSKVYVRVEIVDGIRTLIVTESSRERRKARKTKQETGSRLILTIGVGAIHVTVYDSVPKEVLCLSLRELDINVDTLAEEERQTTVNVMVGDLQLDDQSARTSNEVIICPKTAFLTKRQREAADAESGGSAAGKEKRKTKNSSSVPSRFLMLQMSMYQWDADSGTPTLFFKKFIVQIAPLVITVNSDIYDTLEAYGTSVGTIFGGEGEAGQDGLGGSGDFDVSRMILASPPSSSARVAVERARDGARRVSPAMELWVASLAVPQHVRKRRSDAPSVDSMYFRGLDADGGEEDEDDEDDADEDYDDDDGAAPPIVFYFDELVISDIRLTVNAEIVRPVPLSIDGSQIIVDALSKNQLMVDSNKLTKDITSHYMGALTRQIHKLIFSLEMLGNPISVFQTFADGLNEAGDSYGTSILTKSVLGTGGKAISGVGGVITSVTSTMTMDSEFIQKRADKRRGADRPRGFFNTIKASGSSVADGVWGGVTGLVSAPVRGVKKNGALGLFTGGLKGVVGLVAKPVTGIIDAPMIIVGSLTDTLDRVAHRDRLCKPRLLRGSARVLMEYEKSDEIVYEVLIMRKCLFSAEVVPEKGGKVEDGEAGEGGADAMSVGRRGRESYVHHLSPACERVRRGPHTMATGAPILLLFTTRRIICICDSTRLGVHPQPCTVREWIEDAQRILSEASPPNAATKVLVAEAAKSGHALSEKSLAMLGGGSGGGEGMGGRRGGSKGKGGRKRGSSDARTISRETSTAVRLAGRVLAVQETGRSDGSLLDSRTTNAAFSKGRPLLLWQTGMLDDAAKVEAICARLAPISRVSMLDRNQRVCAAMARRGEQLTFEPTRESLRNKVRMALILRLVRVLGWLHLGCPPPVNAATMRSCWSHIEEYGEGASVSASDVSPRDAASGLGHFKLSLLTDALCMCYQRALSDGVNHLQHPYTLLELVSEHSLCSTLDGEAIRAVTKFRAALDALLESELKSRGSLQIERLESSPRRLSSRLSPGHLRGGTPRV